MIHCTDSHDDADCPYDKCGDCQANADTLDESSDSHGLPSVRLAFPAYGITETLRAVCILKIALGTRWARCIGAEAGGYYDALPLPLPNMQSLNCRCHSICWAGGEPLRGSARQGARA